ncbi:hypothetical protein SAMN06272759_10382 [Novosphingobium sp. B1]|nr:hypothetical protein SAMN06272759_10382 [Novosphingobium sp. B1]
MTSALVPAPFKDVPAKITLAFRAGIVMRRPFAE